MRLKIAQRLADSRHARALGETAQEPSLLAGLIVDSHGERMTPTHAVKKGRRYRYYVSTPLITGTRSHHEAGLRVPAGDVEALVLDRLKKFLASELDVSEALSIIYVEAATMRSALAKAVELSGNWAALPSI